MSRRDNSTTSLRWECLSMLECVESKSNLDPRDDNPKYGATHNQSGMSFDFWSFLLCRPIAHVPPTLYDRSLGGYRLIREFRLTVSIDKHGTRPPSSSPRCKSHAVTSVHRTDYSWQCCTGIHHHSVYSIYAVKCRVVALWRRQVVRPTFWSCRIRFHDPISPPLGSLPSFFISFLYVLFILLHLI